MASAAGLIAVTSAALHLRCRDRRGDGAAAIVGLAVWKPRLLFSPTGVRPPALLAAVAMLLRRARGVVSDQAAQDRRGGVHLQRAAGPIGKAWQKLESLTDGRASPGSGTIRVDGQYYLLHGRRLQLRPRCWRRTRPPIRQVKEVRCSIRAAGVN